MPKIKSKKMNSVNSSVPRRMVLPSISKNFFRISKPLDKQFGRREAPENYAASTNIALARR
jgi:hypothetical protein